jgi:hypothetical protein
MSVSGGFCSRIRLIPADILTDLKITLFAAISGVCQHIHRKQVFPATANKCKNLFSVLVAGNDCLKIMLIISDL